MRHLFIITVTLSLAACATVDPAQQQSQQKSQQQKQIACRGLFSYERQVKPDPEIERQFYQYVSDYGGEGLYFIDFFKRVGTEHCGRPALDYMLFLKGYLRGKPETDFYSMADSVGTAIHETAHHYSSFAARYEKQAAPGRRAYNPLGNTSFYLPGVGYRDLVHTPTFPAEKIHMVIQDKRVLKNSRYRTYIGMATRYHVTQQFGIYGLLDEFHAYYYSVIAKNEILAKIPEEKRRRDLGNNTFMSLGSSDVDLSFLEFKLFILSYFRTAERYHSRHYRQMMKNGELLDVIIRLHDEFDMAYRTTQEMIKQQKLYDAFRKERDILVKELDRAENREMLDKLRQARAGLVPGKA